MRIATAVSVLVAAGLLAATPATAQESLKRGELSAETKAGWERAQPVSGALSFSTTNFEYGKVDEGAVVNAEFPFVNNSDRVVRITDIKSSCGCTATQLAKREFAPGEGEVIRANFNTSGRSGMQKKVVTVTTDDPENPVYRLELSGEVARQLFFDNRMVNFGDVEEGAGGSAELKLISLTENPVRIISLTAQDPGIELEQGESSEYNNPKTGETGTVTPITVSFDEDRPVGNITGSISARIEEDGKQRNLIASMRGRVVGDVMASPSIVSFAIMQPGEEKTVTLDLSVRGNSPFEMSDLEFESLRQAAAGEDVTVTADVVEHVSMPGRQQIKVTLKTPDEGRGAYRGNLVLTGMANEKETSLTLPITAVVRSDSQRQTISRTRATAPQAEQQRIDAAELREKRLEVLKQKASSK